MVQNCNKSIINNGLNVKSKILQNFVNSLPAKPYYADNLREGLRIASLKTAIKHKYIQFNDYAFYRFMIFDIDKEGAALYWEIADLPAPNLAIINPANTHAHLVYQLQDPVCKTENAHLRPLSFLKAIYQAYALKLQADMAFAELITKNPLSPFWKVWQIHDNLFSLGKLADYVELQKLLITKAQLTDDFLGRNDYLFNTIRFWAYKVRYNYNNYNEFKTAIFDKTYLQNLQFDTSLKISEIKSITKSILKFVWEHFTPDSRQKLIKRTHTSALQKERGIKSGIARRIKNEDKRASARLLRAQGKTYREIAAELGISERTIKYWLN